MLAIFRWVQICFLDYLELNFAYSYVHISSTHQHSHVVLQRRFYRRLLLEVLSLIRFMTTKVCLYVHTHTHTHTHTQTQHTHTHIYIYIYIYKFYARAQMHVYMYIYIHIHIYIYVQYSH